MFQKSIWLNLTRVYQSINWKKVHNQFCLIWHEAENCNVKCEACTTVGNKNTLLIVHFLIVQIQKIKIMFYVLSYPFQRDIFEGEWIIKEDRKDKIGWGKIRIRLSYPPQRDVIESGWIILEDRMIGLFSLCSSRDGVDGAQNHITQVHQSTQVHKNTTCAPSPTE